MEAGVSVNTKQLPPLTSLLFSFRHAVKKMVWFPVESVCKPVAQIPISDEVYCLLSHHRTTQLQLGKNTTNYYCLLITVHFFYISIDSHRCD